MEKFDDRVEEQRVIPLSKSKLMLAFLGSLAFVATGIWIVVITEEIYITIVVCVVILFFGLCAVYCFFKLQDNNPGLIISHSGVIDNSSGVAVGEIQWSDVIEMTVLEINGQKMVCMIVHNPEQYIDRQKSFFRRFAMKQSLNMYGTPLIISSVSIKISFDELLGVLNEYYMKSQV